VTYLRQCDVWSLVTSLIFPLRTAPHNAKFSLRELGGKWDYSQTQDQILFDLEKQQEAIKALISDRQKMLKLIPVGGMADPETGNMIFKAAAPATSTTVVVTLK